ncbi:MAG: PrsW family glutamic-type intramembrane protease [Chloroflexota bacterium]
MTVVALLIATAIPLLFLYLVYTLDLYRTGAFRHIITCFVWGIAAFFIATLLNPIFINFGWFDHNTTVRFAAPVVEEILKALFLIYLVRKPTFTYFVDGAIYGFSVGIGFAILENYQYVLGHPEAAMSVAIGRVLSTNLMHASASAMVGIALGLARFQRYTGRIVYLCLGWTLAMGLHITFNNLVTRLSSGLLLLYAMGAGFGGAAVIAMAIKRGLVEEKIWIEENLGMADRVTSGEAAVVHRLDDLEEILKPLAEQFGPTKASAIERFLLVQARLGIMRKMLEKLPDEKMRQAVSIEMDNLRSEMDEVRRSVGAYTMLYLRHIFPPEVSPIWLRLEKIIPESATGRQQKTALDLWAVLEQRTKKEP